MNFLCHALPYLDDPLLAVSTGIPDWLSVVDRKIRARRKLAQRFTDSDDRDLQTVAVGVIRHIEDDRWFHSTQAFVDTNLRLAVGLRDQLPGDNGFRPMFVGHILIEMLLDSYWIRDDRSIAERYFNSLRAVDAGLIERCVNSITQRPTDKLAPLIRQFTEMQFLYDYLDHGKLLFRINQVMRRVGLTQLPETLLDWLADADKLVESRRQRLLTPPNGTNPFSFAG